ncbi:nicotinate (nicotinamide) nucleotide adenylyltransferase [Candidatus Saccharibacteria bacterium]|nr:nicotinate (nicotinamide) nucleotide adenylyltransferase [Candidatus Saccharibacteria bacterium]
MKVAIYGGSFDPIHIGHQKIIHYLLGQDYDRVIVMPTGLPLHKGRMVSNSEHRLAMIGIATSGLSDRLVISSMEIDRVGPTDTIDTIRELITEGYKKEELVFCLGSDSFVSLTSWPSWQNLIELIRFEVFIREGSGHGADQVKQFLDNCYTKYSVKQGTIRYNLFEIGIPEVSSTRIRADLEEFGRNNLDPRVLRYINQHGLYVQI